MAIKRIKKMILGLFCFVFSTSALAYNFLPAYAPAVVDDRPRVERAQPVADEAMPAAIGMPVPQLSAKAVPTTGTPLVAAKQLASADPTATINEKWVAAWIPVAPKAEAEKPGTLVSEWVPVPASQNATDVELSNIAAAARSQTFSINEKLKLQPRPVRFVAASLPKLSTPFSSATTLEPQPEPPAIRNNRDLRMAAIAALDPRPVISFLMEGSPAARLPQVQDQGTPPVGSAINIAVPSSPVKIEARSMLALPDPPSGFRGLVAIITDPRPEISWAIGARHTDDLSNGQDNHTANPLGNAPDEPVVRLQLPTLAALPRQALIAPTIRPMASLIMQPRIQSPAVSTFALAALPFASPVSRPLVAMPSAPVFAAAAKPLNSIAFETRLAPEVVTPTLPPATVVSRAEVSMPHAPKPVVERMAETLKNPLPLVSYALFGPSIAPMPSVSAIQSATEPPPPSTMAMAKNISVPVPITGQITLGQALLASLENRIESADPLALTTAGGPSWTPSDSPAAMAIPNAASEAKPLTITASAGFSSDFLRPMSTRPVFPPNPDSYAVSTPLPGQTTEPGSYCDPNFVGPPIRFAQTVDLRLDDLLGQLNQRFGVNFVVGPEVGKLPLNVKAGSIPWNVLLKSQLYVSGVRATCIGNDTVQLVLNNKVGELEKGKKDAEELQTRYIKLKYLQPSSSGNQNIAGQNTSGGSTSQGNQSGGDCQQGANGVGGGGGGGGFGGGGGVGGMQNLPQRCKFERLMMEIKQMLGLNNQNPSATIITDSANGSAVDSGQRRDVAGNGQSVYRLADEVRRPYVGQVPGRNMLIVNAAPSQLAEIEELIRHADVPPFQVVIKALVYTANESKLRDIGAQTSVIFGNGNLKQLGGITSQPSVSSTTSTGSTSGSSSGTGSTSTSTGTTTSTTVAPGLLNPGGVRTLGPGFLTPLGTGDSVFGLSAIVGTAQFSMQVTALQQNGVLALKSRPFATVLDGNEAQLSVGRQIPVIIQAANNIGGSPGTLDILQAANLLSVTPHVIDDENGNPTAVNLELRLESNDVDTSVVSQGVPAVSVKSIQSNFILNQEQTAILGGFTVDSDSKTVSKTPGLGDVPILGELFKRRVNSSQINRLYFAISVTVIPYGGAIEPVQVPGGTTDPPTLTPNMVKRADAAEPPKAVPSPTPKH